MNAWEAAINELRAEYLREVPLRLAELTQLLHHVAAAPADAPALAELLRAFHSLRGSGQTYGLAAVGEIAHRGETRCRLAATAGGASGADLREWGNVIEELRHQLAQTGPALPAASPVALPGAEANPADVLVVDDDESIRGLLSNVLARQGYAVRTAETLAQARAELAARLPDVAVVDVTLPDGTGFELIRFLRGLPGGEAPGVVVVSVRAAFEDRVEAIHCGADAHFEKPVDWDAMAEAVRALVQAHSAQPARVLSVEDDPQQAALLRSVLESGGYDVRVCADPARFAVDLAAFRPDIVLMDVVLPGMSGYDLVRYLRQDEQYATVPVLMLTGEGRLEARIKATRAGADDFLIKPVSPGLLLSGVSARVERARFLRTLIDRDGLTHLLTHSAFIERARAAFARLSRQPERRTAWVMIDVDHFKSVNDRFGHPTGDRVLATLAGHLRRHLRESDTVGRYGGEEFGILLEDVSEADAARLVERLRVEFATMAHTSPDNSEFRVTFSAGVACASAGGTLDDWREAADAALYAAKRAGRNRIVVSSGEVSSAGAAPFSDCAGFSRVDGLVAGRA